MGVTHSEIPILRKLINEYGIKSVIELGAQQQYTEGEVYGRYMSEWYRENGIQIYRAIDLNGENNSYKIDLSEIIPEIQLSHFYAHTEPFRCHDLVTDFGTSEHVIESEENKFSWQAIYNCWKNKFNLCELNGWIYSVNPMSGNWPGHGYNYYTQDFYIQLANVSGLTIFLLDILPAMGNVTDGWNVICLMRKVIEKFPTFDEFKLLDLRQE